MRTPSRHGTRRGCGGIPRRPRPSAGVRRPRSPGMSPGARYALRSVGSGLATLAFVVVFNFFLFRMLPGDPIGLYTRGRNVATRADRQAARRARQADPRAVPHLHLQPVRVHHQLRAVQPAGVGADRRPDRADPAAGRAPRSLLASIIGTLIGIRAAWKRGERFDSVSSAVTLTLYAMPEFWLGHDPADHVRGRHGRHPGHLPDRRDHHPRRGPARASRACSTSPGTWCCR